MRFLTAQLNRTSIKQITGMKDTQKCTKYQETGLFSHNMVACFCHHLSDNYVDLSDIYVDLSDLYVDLSDLYVDLSLIPSVEK